MNFDDFARQMILKYKVAIAVAVLKSKPDNISIHQHINVQRNKMEIADDYDSDVTLCSDDFLLHDDQGNNDDFNGNLNNENLNNPLNNDNINDYINNSNFKDIQNNDNLNNTLNYDNFKDTPYGGNFNYLIYENLKGTVNNDNYNNSSNNDYLNNDFDNECGRDEDLNASCETESSLNILEGYDPGYLGNDAGEEANKVSQALNMPQAGEVAPPGNQIRICDSQANTQSTFFENTQSQNPLHGFQLNQSQQTFFESNTCYNEDQTYYTQNVNKDKIHCENLNKFTSTQNTVFDSQKTELYSLREIPDQNTCYSQSQTEFVHVKSNQLFNVHGRNKIIINDLKQKEMIDCREMINETNTQINEPNNNCKPILSKSTNVTQTNQFGYDLNRDKPVSSHSQLSANESNDIQTIIVTATTTEAFNENCLQSENCIIQDNTQNVIRNKDDADEFIESSQVEIVPFKVIVELNKVKNYLSGENMEAGCFGADSGYKSDSQGRSYKPATCKQDTWVNQSAQCLVNFITNCPMVTKARDITEDISRVLGNLIDRLHEDEKYPAFLEEILNLVTNLLRDIYEGDNCVQDATRRKDENINRLLLMNRSHQIIKYTVEKIINTLERFYSQIDDEDLLELSHTNETENLCYLLHVLEELLKRYSSSKAFVSQKSSQASQGDGRLTKTSLTDVWKRKWNDKYRPVEDRSQVDEKCIETSCTQVLNKIIVKAMDGYSLVSFAALQCFNLLQN